uniref:Protein kinase domain-containing protein n=1 Tax=Anabas testudineus TaxID=64144 RepID=A0A3Q1IQ11_ANATE
MATAGGNGGVAQSPVVFSGDGRGCSTHPVYYTLKRQKINLTVHLLMERYESLGLVGEGSYGTVLKCRHRDTGRLVAIKKFMDSDSDKTVKKIATREIKLLRKLHHDNLVNLLEVWKRRRRWYLVFEFVERTLLDDLELNQSGLDLNTTQQYLYQILRAAAFCHEQNIIHRDIKPENILISQGGVVKLCDFGFARTIASSAEGDVYTDYVATRWYRAPELLVGDIKYGKPVDVWAVGCLFLEMLTGQALFPGDSDLDQIYHIVRCFGNLTAYHQEVFCRNHVFSGVRLPECSVRVPLQERCPTITPTALDLAQSCLQMDPEGRAQCSHLLEHLFFTQDCFHLRFLEKLNAKIRKDHRENSTLPKITKTLRQDKDDGNDKNQKGKDKKQLGDVDEKLNKGKEKKDIKEEEKLEKTKGKQLSKPSTTIHNTTETLMTTKQSKTLGAKVMDNTARASVGIKSKPGKATGAELIKEIDISETLSNSSEKNWTRADLKDTNKVAAKPKHGKVVSPELGQDYLKSKINSKDADSTNLCFRYSDIAVPSETENNLMGIWRPTKSEPSQGLSKSWSNVNINVPKTSQSSTTNHPNLSSFSQASLETTVEPTGTSWALQAHQPSSNDHSKVTTISISSVTKPCKTITTVEHQSIITAPKAQKVSDNKDREDSLFSLSTCATTLSIVNQTSEVSGRSSKEQRNNNSETESDGSHSKSLISEPEENLGSFSNHRKSPSTTTQKTQKTTYHIDAWKNTDNPGRSGTTNIFSVTESTSVPSTATPDQRPLTRSFVLHNMDPAALNEGAQYSYPPPPPSSTPVLLPPPSTYLMPPSIVTNSTAISDHLIPRTSFHPVNLNLRGVDKPRDHGAIHSRLAQKAFIKPHYSINTGFG